MVSSAENLTILMIISLGVLLVLGLPLAFVTGSLGVIFIYVVGNQLMLNIIPARIFPLMTNYQLSAIPLFIFMASMLERAGLIDEMFDVLYKWMDRLRGGLAIATILASTILAAMVGVIGAAVVTMGIIALPYDAQTLLSSSYCLRIDYGWRNSGNFDTSIDISDYLCGCCSTVRRGALYWCDLYRV